MGQSLQQVWPEVGHRGHGRHGGDGGLAPAFSYGGRRVRDVLIWRQRAPRATFRERVAGWRARNWRRAVLAWFVLSMVIMAVMAEPKTDFPKAQARSVPAVRMFFRVAGGLTAAGVPVVLIALP